MILFFNALAINVFKHLKNGYLNIILEIAYWEGERGYSLKNRDVNVKHNFQNSIVIFEHVC
jgi:hypothetical protein